MQEARTDQPQKKRRDRRDYSKSYYQAHKENWKTYRINSLKKTISQTINIVKAERETE